MITTEAIRRLLAIADVGKDPYAVAASAASLLAADGRDSVALEHYVRALATLKLTAAAHRLLNAAAPADGGGMVPWTSRARRFAANLRALEIRTPQGAALVRQAADELSSFELHQAADGNFQVLDTRQPIPAGWVGGLADHKATVRIWQFDPAQAPIPHPVAFDGAGFGWLLVRAAETTQRSFLNYSCAIYVVESDPLALAMMLHMHDLQDLIAQERMRWFIGANAQAVLTEFRHAVETQPSWSIPRQFVLCPLRGRTPLALEVVTQELSAGRDKQRDKFLAEIRGYYAGKDAVYWHRRYEEARTGKGEPLRVLGLTSRFTTVLQYSVSELRAAVEASRGMPCRMDISIESDDQSLEDTSLEKIAAIKPDLIVQISRMRYENPNLPREVPFLCWDQDNLPCMRTDGATASLDRLTYVAGHGAFHGYVYLGWPRRNCMMCQPAAATHRYAPRELSAAELDRYGCDLSYVSNASGSAAKLREKLAGQWKNDAHTEALFTGLTDAVLAQSQSREIWNSSRLHGILDELQKRRKIELAPRAVDEMLMNAVTVADRAFRHSVLEWAADLADQRSYSLRLYGKGWELHPRLAKFAAGMARPGDELRTIYQASKINLQIIETGFLHARALDGMAAGGFFLTHRTDYDGLDTVAVQARHNLSLHIQSHGINRIDQLEKSPDPQVRQWWQIIRQGLYESAPGVIFRPDELLRGLEVFAETPAACIIFPQFDQIAFTDQESFSIRVQKFLADDTLRHAIAGQMRQVVLDHFSYDARWKKFLAGIVVGLSG